MEWNDLADDIDRWWALMNAGDEASGSIKCEEFLDWTRNCQLLRKDSALWS